MRRPRLVFSLPEERGVAAVRLHPAVAVSVSLDSLGRRSGPPFPDGLCFSASSAFVLTRTPQYLPRVDLGPEGPLVSGVSLLSFMA